MKKKNFKREQQEIARQMADYFCSKICNTDLSMWIAHTSQMVYDVHTEKGEKFKDSEAHSFISDIGGSILPALVECKSESDRISVLTTELPWLFVNRFYNGSKKALAEIGSCYFKNYVEFISDSDDVDKFFVVFSALIHLCEMYNEYEFSMKQQSSQETKLIAA